MALQAWKFKGTHPADHLLQQHDSATAEPSAWYSPELNHQKIVPQYIQDPKQHFYRTGAGIQGHLHLQVVALSQATA